MPLLLTRMSHRGFLSVALLCLLGAACPKSPGRDTRYPRQRPGCALAIYNGLPTSGPWDDIGVAQVDCYLDESEVACLGRLRTEACGMGGDIVYNLPKKASRPVERGMIYRAQVAHTRGANKKAEPEPAATPDAGSGPVLPLPKAAAAAVPAPVSPPAPAPDAGAGADGSVAPPAPGHQ